MKLALEWGPVARPSKHGNEIYDYIKGEVSLAVEWKLVKPY
jgi:hypothetical protein